MGPIPLTRSHTWPAARAVAGAVAIAVGVMRPGGLPDWCIGVLLIGGFVLLADALSVMSRRVLSPRYCLRNERLRMAVGPLVGTMYAVVLGFVVVTTWQTLASASSTVVREANAVADLERLSRGLPVHDRRQIQQAARAYVRLVIDEEWPALAQRSSSERAHAALVELWGVYTAMDPQHRTDPIYDESLARLNELTESRHQRLLAADEQLPAIMWTLVVTGGIAVLVLSLNAGVPKNWQARMIVAVPAGMISLAILLIGTLEGPFQGGLSVSPEPFVSVLEGMAQLER